MLLHFTLVFIYANPVSHPKNKTDYWSEYYVYPFFHQSWSLFAPPPTSNYKLFVYYENKGLKQTELYSDILADHQANRFKGYESLILALSNSIYYFEKYAELNPKAEGPIRNDTYFKMIEQFSTNYLQWKHKIKLKRVQLILISENIKNKDQKLYFN